MTNEAAAPAPAPRRAAVGQSAAQGIGKIGGARLLAQLIQFAASIVLARLVAPSEYGVFAIVVSISAFAAIVNEFGLVETLIRWPQLSRVQTDAAFWLNFATGITLVAASSIASPIVARIFNQGELLWLLPLASLIFVINTNTVQIAMLQKHKSFGVVARADISGASVNAVVSISLAFAGLGTLALVVGLLMGGVATTSILWGQVRFIPGRPVRSEMTTLARGSFGNVGYSTSTWASSNIDTLIIGAAATASTLGLYNRAYNLSRMPSMLVSGVLNKVLLPVYASNQNDLVWLRQTWARYATLTLLFLVPASAAMSATSADLVVLLYGGQWADAGAYLALLAWCIPAFAVASTLGPFIYLLGRQRHVLLAGLTQSVVGVAIVSIGSFWGTWGVVIGVVVAAYVAHAALIIPCMRLLGLRSQNLLTVMWRPAATAAVVFVACQVGRGFDNLLLRLTVDLISGGVAGLAVALALSREARSLAGGLWVRMGRWR